MSRTIGYVTGCGHQPVWKRLPNTLENGSPAKELQEMAAQPCPKCGGRMEASVANRGYHSAVHVVECVEPTPDAKVQEFLDRGGFGGQRGLAALGAIVERIM
jgi:hypothetical protein